LCFENEEIAESLFIEINNSIGKNIIVGVIYRPPNQDVTSFLTSYNELLSKITKENKTCYIMGDFNLNVLRVNVKIKQTNFKNRGKIKNFVFFQIFILDRQ
jgi:exonuclease III